nr:RNA-directed DNA polymerase, eukaryota [Tanacetum cinerariifolium]
MESLHLSFSRAVDVGIFKFIKIDSSLTVSHLFYADDAIFIGELTLLKAVLGSTPIYNMSIYKLPKSVLHTMESLRRNFFNGVQADERNITWIKWYKVLASKKYEGGTESAQLDLLEKSIEGTILSSLDERWFWDLNGEGVFQVKDVRFLLDEHFLPRDSTATRWVNYVPIKINMFAWKVFLDRLPTRLNLAKRGV